MANVLAHRSAPHDSSSRPRAPHASSAGLDTSTVTDYKVMASKHGFKVRAWIGGNDQFWWGLASTQGRRPNMEDAHLVDLDLDGKRTSMFGVFDGHTGQEVAAYCAQHMRDALLAAPSYQNGSSMEDVLNEAYLTVEKWMRDPAAKEDLYCLREGIKPGTLDSHPHAMQDAAKTYGMYDENTGAYLGPKAGCTASVAVVRGDRVSVAHVGDSRCVLSDNGKAVALTRDHKASDPEEAKRVVKAGLSIERNRVRSKTSSLAMTRTLGDTKYKQHQLPPEKQAVTPVPDTTTAPVDILGGAAAGTPAVEQLGVADFLVLACDGLWDCVTNQQAVTYLAVAMEQGLSPKNAAVALLEEVLDPHSATPASMDNITIMVVQFAPMPEISA